jgi:hypothetical protein
MRVGTATSVGMDDSFGGAAQWTGEPERGRLRECPRREARTGMTLRDHIVSEQRRPVW